MALVAFFLWLSGCGDTADNNVVARVDTAEITVEDLLRFNGDMPALLRSEEEGVQVWREYLDSMVDMELMLLEARKQGIDQDSEFLGKWEHERRQKLLGEILRREIQEKSNLSSDELRRSFEQSKWNRMLKLAHIQVETEKDAREVMEELEQGKEFGEVAKLRSTDRETASQGGLLGPLYGRGNVEEQGMPVEVAEEVFALEVGKISQPFEIGDRYEIFHVVAEGPPPASYAFIYARVQITETSRARHKELIEELATQFEVQLDQEGISFLLERAPSSGADTLDIAKREQEVVLCRFDGGQLTLKDFADTYQRVRRFRSVRFDSSGIAEFIYRELLPVPLLFEAALKQGIDQDSSVAAWLEAKKKAMLIGTLKEWEVDRRIDLSDEAVRSYYESHLHLFKKPEQITVQEILCTTREEAEEVLKRILNGEEMERLAERYSIRSGAEKTKGFINMHKYGQAHYGPLYDEALKAEVGELKGPLQIEEGYTVFKVVEKSGLKPDPFEKASTRARYWLRKEKEEELINTLLLSLKEKYASKIVLFEDRLKKMDAEVGI